MDMRGTKLVKEMHHLPKGTSSFSTQYCLNCCMIAAGLTEYRYYKAKNHSAVYGCALPPPCNEQLRQRMDPYKLDSFLDFITSSNIIKDLPFGERKLRLSNGKVVETPNVIRCMAPAAIIQQFKQYCVENDEVPLGNIHFQ
jgi:hypothetical protein